MKIVIDIPEDVVNSDDYLSYFGVISSKLYNTLHNGIPYEKRPAGHWIYKNPKDYKCSCCGYSDTNDVAPYCWYCGADMQGLNDEQLL